MSLHAISLPDLKISGNLAASLVAQVAYEQCDRTDSFFRMVDQNFKYTAVPMFLEYVSNNLDSPFDLSNHFRSRLSIFIKSLTIQPNAQARGIRSRLNYEQDSSASGSFVPRVNNSRMIRRRPRARRFRAWTRSSVSRDGVSSLEMDVIRDLPESILEGGLLSDYLTEFAHIPPKIGLYKRYIHKIGVCKWCDMVASHGPVDKDLNLLLDGVFGNIHFAVHAWCSSKKMFSFVDFADRIDILNRDNDFPSLQTYLSWIKGLESSNLPDLSNDELSSECSEMLVTDPNLLLDLNMATTECAEV